MEIRIHPDILSIQDRIIATRRDIHAHPERAFAVARTAGLVAERLQVLGYQVRTGIGQVGVVGDLRGRESGPTLALRADMDALPVTESNPVPYRSTIPGLMHACGHDGHTAILLGVAEALASRREKLRGSVRLLFQPGEEGEGGARYMIADGCLEDVDEIYGLHLWNYQPYGEIGVQSGPVLAASDIFEIQVEGLGGHAATPQNTVDAIVVGAHLVTALQTIVSRNTNPLENTVVTIGKFTGGSNFNVIAERVHMHGTARAFTEANRMLLKTRLQEITRGIGETFGATIKLDYEDGYPPTVNHPGATKKVLRAARKVVGEGVVKPFLSMGGEDFAYYAREIPGCFFFVGSAPVGTKPMSVPHHCSHFDIDERSLALGATVFLQLVQDLLIRP